jgi:rubrerythrin
MADETAPVTETITELVLPAASCDLSTTCMVCGSPMSAEHAHYRCPACGWRDSCCM